CGRRPCSSTTSSGAGASRTPRASCSPRAASCGSATTSPSDCSTGSWTAAARLPARAARSRSTSPSRSTSTPRWRRPDGGRSSSTTSISGSRTRPRSAPPTSCRSPTARSTRCSCSRPWRSRCSPWSSPARSTRSPDRRHTRAPLPAAVPRGSIGGMPHTLYVLAASYDDVDDALAEYAAIEAAYTHVSSSSGFDATVVAKDARGKVQIVRRHDEPVRHGTSEGLMWGLAGGAGAALFAAVGILGGLAVGGGSGAALGAMAGPAGEALSRDDLKALGDVLDG